MGLVPSSACRNYINFDFFFINSGVPVDMNHSLKLCDSNKSLVVVVWQHPDRQNCNGLLIPGLGHASVLVLNWEPRIKKRSKIDFYVYEYPSPPRSPPPPPKKIWVIVINFPSNTLLQESVACRIYVHESKVTAHCKSYLKVRWLHIYVCSL